MVVVSTEKTRRTMLALSLYPATKVLVYIYPATKVLVYERNSQKVTF